MVEAFVALGLGGVLAFVLAGPAGLARPSSGTPSGAPTKASKPGADAKRPNASPAPAARTSTPAKPDREPQAPKKSTQTARKFK